MSKSHKEDYTHTYKAVRCATFFGTPHQGMSVGPLKNMASKRAHENMKQTLNDLDRRSDSEILRMLRETLTMLASSSHVRLITCIEQKLTSVPVREILLYRVRVMFTPA